MVGPNLGLHSVLDLHAEKLSIRQVNPAIHISKAVRRTYDGARRPVEDVAFNNLNIRRVAESFSPSQGHVGVECV